MLDLGAGHRIDPEPAEQRRGVQRGGLRPQPPARRRACLPGTVRRDDRSIQRATPMILRAVKQAHGRAARTASVRRPEEGPMPSFDASADR